MKYRALFCALVGSISLIGASAQAEWTGDPDTEIWSNVRIIAFSSGQLNGHRYFCIAGKNGDSASNIQKACASTNQDTSVFSLSYDALYKQAVYYYGTGQKVAMYYKQADFKYAPFSAAFKSNFIRGFATCEINSAGKSVCFGPIATK